MAPRPITRASTSYSIGDTTVWILQQCGDDLIRENVMPVTRRGVVCSHRTLCWHAGSFLGDFRTPRGARNSSRNRNSRSGVRNGNKQRVVHCDWQRGGRSRRAFAVRRIRLAPKAGQQSRPDGTLARGPCAHPERKSGMISARSQTEQPSDTGNRTERSRGVGDYNEIRAHTEIIMRYRRYPSELPTQSLS
jgi:hypothetical protein